MHQFDTLRADAVTENPAPHQVCLYEAALWGPVRDLRTALRRMRPAFTVGGFPMPPFRRGRMLVIDAGAALPPTGGYVEEVGGEGRQDGRSCSLLAMAPSRGGPRVTHLHIAPGTAESARRHAGGRIGIVVRGRGRAHHECGPPMALYPGRGWRIPAGERYRFETDEEALDIVVFQPESDWSAAAEARGMPDAATALA